MSEFVEARARKIAGAFDGFRDERAELHDALDELFALASRAKQAETELKIARRMQAVFKDDEVAKLEARLAEAEEQRSQWRYSSDMAIRRAEDLTARLAEAEAEQKRIIKDSGLVITRTRKRAEKAEARLAEAEKELDRYRAAILDALRQIAKPDPEQKP